MALMQAGENEKTGLILDLIRQYTAQFTEGNYPREKSIGIDEIMASLNKLEEELQAKTTYLKKNQKRVDGILDVLMQFTMSDFTKRAEISDAGDELDAIALGLNTLAEELDVARSNEKKYIQELENTNKELKSFTYIASHDLQEPLRNIKMFSNILLERERNQLSEKGAQILDKISLASSRMQRLIDDLLSFSRVQTYTEEFRQVDLNDIVSEIKITHDDSIRNGYLVIESDRLPVIQGIAFQLQQLFENIINNSIKYSKANSATCIKISCETVKGNVLPCEGAVADKTYYRLYFSDNGIGFDQKYAERIFEIFQRLHGKDEYSGTGIGLAICKKIAQNHTGFIYATGKTDEGAAFYVCLPTGND